MICNHCGTALPLGAIFCGECGRRVTAAPAPVDPALMIPPPPPAPELQGPPASPSGPIPQEQLADAAARAAQADPAPAPRDPVRPVAQPPAAAPGRLDDDDDLAAETVYTGSGSGSARSAAEQALDSVSAHPLECTQCGAMLGPGDIFCGECGAVSKLVTSAFTRSIPQVPGTPAETRPAPSQAPAPTAPPVQPPIVAPPTVPPVQPPPVAPPRQPPMPSPAVAAPAQSGPARQPVPAVHEPDDDLDATRIVQRPTGERFVLQFSTGESVTVRGTGLVGRNPRPEPGEYFDQLVRVLDAGRSVSKTHLEFGQDGGTFWIKDRFSGNGSMLREPDGQPRRCEPDRRYRVPRGSRVEIGEQFFVVS